MATETSLSGPPGSDTEETSRLWEAYDGKRGTELRNRLMEQYLPFVRCIAKRLHRNFPSHVELDDLVSAAVFGLTKAVETFDIRRGVKFHTYGGLRIRGAILDELRRVDTAPRSLRDKACAMQRALESLEADLGRRPTDDEVAEMLGLTLTQFRRLLTKVHAVNQRSLYEHVGPGEDDMTPQRWVDVLEDTSQPSPHEHAEREDLFEVLTRDLSAKERTILSLYYYDRLTLREIALVLGISESRVSQLHTRARGRLREQFADVRDELMA
ncbi:FliA/WhiG family RNA polymerase sigma factor [Planctomycetota bacterium]